MRLVRPAAVTPNTHATIGRSFTGRGNWRSRSTSGGIWSGVSSAGNSWAGGSGAAANADCAWDRSAARLSSISTGSPKTKPNCRAARCSKSFESGQGRRVRNLAGKARHGPVGDAAGVDQAEIVEIGGHVEREPVRGDAAGHVNADRGNLALTCGRIFRRPPTALFQKAAALQVPRRKPAPDASEAADASGRHAQLAAEPDKRLFHQANEVDRAKAVAAGIAQAAQIEDGVADELAGAVIGHVAAAVDLVERDAARGQQLIGGKNVGAAGVAAQREHGRVLQQQQHVADAALRCAGRPALPAGAVLRA